MTHLESPENFFQHLVWLQEAEGVQIRPESTRLTHAITEYYASPDSTKLRKIIEATFALGLKIGAHREKRKWVREELGHGN